MTSMSDPPQASTCNSFVTGLCLRQCTGFGNKEKAFTAACLISLFSILHMHSLLHTMAWQEEWEHAF